MEQGSPEFCLSCGMPLSMPDAKGLSEQYCKHCTDDDGSVFEADIDRLGTAGVTRGCNPPVNDMFCPNQNVTREQMAAFLHRALGDIVDLPD